MPKVKLVHFRGEKHTPPSIPSVLHHDGVRQKFHDAQFRSDILDACEMCVITMAIYYSEKRNGDSCKQTTSTPPIHYGEAKKKIGLLRLEMQDELKLIAGDMSDSPYVLIDRLQQKFAEKLADLL